jgi:transcriptional regulator GlxA family with amidase domain
LPCGYPEDTPAPAFGASVVFDIIAAICDSIGMKTVRYAIIEYPGCLASNCAGWREIFGLSRRFAAHGPLLAESPARLADLVLVPGCLGSGHRAACHPSVLAALKKARGRGATIAAACAGVTALLEAGADGGLPLTTHWALAEALAAEFPEARIDARELVMDKGEIVTAGGALAWIDLGLHLVGRFVSREAARACAGILVWDPARARQSPYAPASLGMQPVHPDPLLSKAEAWAKKRLGGELSVDEWARGAGIGKRSLERRWKLAYGKAPAAWLRAARVARARDLLEAGERGWAEIAASCGYADPSRFSAAFKAETGWSPRRYRQAFGRGG